MMNRLTLPFLLTLAQFAGAGELILQNGRDGYQGASDVTLVGEPESRRERNFGGTPWLHVAGVAQGGLRQLTLIRFDALAEQIPKGKKIKAAYLELHKIGEPKNTGQYDKVEPKERVIALYAVQRPWQSGSEKGEPDPHGATYSTRGTNSEGVVEYWGNANQIEMGPVKQVDYVGREIARSPLRPDEMSIWIQWPLTALAQQWVDDPASNHGVLLSARSFYVGSHFASSEAENVEIRPRLILEY